jgi:hypothetical protein
MIILGGEPPFVEQPEPEFGEVIVTLNELDRVTREATENFNKTVKQRITDLNTFIDGYVASVTGLSDTHVAKRGAAHGETKVTVGLSKKDNFRTATLAEQIAFANVNAYVTPQGARQAIVQNNAQFVTTNLQLNDVFQLASLYTPDEYPVAVPDTVLGTRYFNQGARAPVLFNGDRLIFQPVSDGAQFSRQTLFYSGATKTSAKTRLAEIVNITSLYQGRGWNQTGCDSSNGRTNFFRSLADKKVYQFINSLGLPAGERNYLLYKAFGSYTFKGLAISLAVAGGTLTIHHSFFYVDAINTNPNMVPVVTTAYPATFDQINKATYSAPAIGSHSYNAADFLDVPAGTTLALGSPSSALYWNAQDVELHLHVAVPVTATLNGVSKVFTLEFTESVQPGKLVAGGSAIFKQLGSRTKDVLQADLTLKGTPSFFKATDPFNFMDMSQWPGVVLNSGDVVKAATTKYALRTKRYKSSHAGLKAFVGSDRGNINVKYASTEIYAPARHQPFGAVPERIIPVGSDATSISFLSYCADPSNGRYEWRNVAWSSASPVGVTTGDGKFGIRTPDQLEENKVVANIPSSLRVLVNKAATGVSLDGLCFTTGNNFTGKASVAYSANTRSFTVGADVALARDSKNGLTALLSQVTTRARGLYPDLNDKLRVPQIQVFAITANRALVVFTDGLNYAEAGVSPFTLAGNVFTLQNVTTGSLPLTRVTPGNAAVPVGTSRTSQSGDDVWSKSSDLLVTRTSADVYSFVLTRAFGEVYGDVSFSVTGFTGAPVFAAGGVNPARLYSGTQQFDLVEELFPALLIPNKGVYQYDGNSGAFATNLREVGGASFMDPYEVNEAGWVRLPSGTRVVLSGRTYILDKDYAVKVGTTGTYYCYLVRQAGAVTAIAQTIRREPGNNEVMFGIARNGILELNKDFLVMYDHQVSATRQGSAIPVFQDDGNLGTNQFFTRRDVK